MDISDWIPKTFHCLRNYSLSLFKKDLLAGVTVGVIALPLAMAFAIASGASPERGLFTAIIAGFLISALGGSRVQIGGPTGAFVVLIYSIISRTGYGGLCTSTLIAALLLVLLGLFRVGSWIKYVPHSVVIGFTTGIACLIFSTQIKDLLGLQMDSLPVSFIDKWSAYFSYFSTALPTTALLSLGTLGVIFLLRRFFPKAPWGICAIVLATLLAFFLHLPVETIQSRFGSIPSTLPWPSLPDLSIPSGMWGEVIQNGIAIAFLGGIESLLSAVIGDNMSGARHRPNCELVAQGVANFFSILFGGIPATGAIARTAANIRTGAQTPMAGMIHAAVLLLILLFLSPLVVHIPLAALAAVLVMISWNMSELPHFFRILKSPFADRIVLVITFLLTVLVDITVAIFAGMILSSFLFMKQMSNLSKVPHLKEDQEKLPPHVEVYEMEGPLFFGASHLFKDLFVNRTSYPTVCILRLHSMSYIDASGLFALEEFYKECQKKKIHLFLSGVCQKKRESLGHVIASLGEKHIFADMSSALQEASRKT
ncbi:MAG: STAS domain-containing protein [Verrucomicrobiota bacterium]|nr:STAS domain-containing protein [Verrucomicrobiota bacterium]